MKNHFDYEMPLSWDLIPKEYKWVALNKRNHYIRGAEMGLIYIVSAFKGMPFPFVAEPYNEIKWLSDDPDKNYEHHIAFEPEQEEEIRLRVLKHTGGRKIEFGKAIWQRP
jgi:hypothetical protein